MPLPIAPLSLPLLLPLARPLVVVFFLLFRRFCTGEISIANNALKYSLALKPVSSRTGGSTFKNPPNESAWKLIEKINYRGRRLGGALVSKHHTNFMINDSLASSLDIELLGEEIREKVWQKFKINLDWEIKRVGKYKKI